MTLGVRLANFAGSRPSKICGLDQVVVHRDQGVVSLCRSGTTEPCGENTLIAARWICSRSLTSATSVRSVSGFLYPYQLFKDCSCNSKNGDRLRDQGPGPRNL